MKEGENIEMKCRLEEEIDESDVTVSWFFKDEPLTQGDRVQLTFDGIFAKIFVAGYWCYFYFSKIVSYFYIFSSVTMADAGAYKCHFKNAKGEDSTQGKVTVKPVSYHTSNNMT